MGWVYNLKTPDAPTEAPRLIAIAITLSAVASIAILLRLYVRISVTKQLRLDDYAALSSVVRCLPTPSVIGISMSRS